MKSTLPARGSMGGHFCGLGDVSSVVCFCSSSNGFYSLGKVCRTAPLLCFQGAVLRQALSLLLLGEFLLLVQPIRYAKSESAKNSVQTSMLWIHMAVAVSSSSPAFSLSIFLHNTSSLLASSARVKHFPPPSTNSKYYSATTKHILSIDCNNALSSQLRGSQCPTNSQTPQTLPPSESQNPGTLSH